MFVCLFVSVQTAADVSYYLTQCLQHVYFATSTLWGPGRILGTDTVNAGEDLISFK